MPTMRRAVIKYVFTRQVCDISVSELRDLKRSDESLHGIWRITFLGLIVGDRQM